MTKNYKGITNFALKPAETEFIFISGKVKRLISTEEGSVVSFWVEGDRRDGYFVDSFDIGAETPIFGHIESLGDSKDEWIVSILTANTTLALPDFPYQKEFNSTYIKSLQDQGYIIKMYYYSPGFKKEFTIDVVNDLFPEERPDLSDYLYTGGFWGVGNYFSSSTFEELTTKYYNVESLTDTVDFQGYNEVPLGMSYSNAINLKETGRDTPPFYMRITRVPLEDRLVRHPNPVENFLENSDRLDKDDVPVVYNLFFGKHYLKSNSQNYYSTALNTSYPHHYTDYKYNNKFLGQITRHCFFGKTK